MVVKHEFIQFESRGFSGHTYSNSQTTTMVVNIESFHGVNFFDKTVSFGRWNDIVVEDETFDAIVRFLDPTIL